MPYRRTSGGGGSQPVDSDLTTIAGLTATTDNVVQSVGSAWASRTPAQLLATLAHDHSSGSVGGAISPAGLPDIRPLGWILNNLTSCNYPDPSVCTSATSTAASTHYVFKCYTPQAITVTDVLFYVGTGGATCAGFYAAVFDSTGALYAGTASADRGTQFHNTAALASLPLGAAQAVPAGFFYIGFKTGTAGTQPMVQRGASAINNWNLATGVASASAPRHGTAANDWTGGTPPGTLGSITALSTPAFLVATR